MNANFKNNGIIVFVGYLLIAGLLLWVGSEKIGLPWTVQSASAEARILTELRLPRLLLCLLVGGALSMVGTSYQIMFQNSLAEPYLLGVASAVTLGFVGGEQIFHLTQQGIGSHLLGVLLGLLASLGLIFFSLTRAGREGNRLVLFGMAMNFVLSSFLFLLVSFASEQVGGSLRWLFGQIPWVTYQELLPLAGVVLPACFFLWLLGRKLDLIAYGNLTARSLGTNPTQVRILLLLLTGVVLAFSVSLTGSIGFVGLVIPHAVRLFFSTTSTRPLFCYGFLVGGIFLAAADAISRVLMPPFEFPIGTITTLLGGPLFLYLLVRR